MTREAWSTRPGPDRGTLFLVVPGYGESLLSATDAYALGHRLLAASEDARRVGLSPAFTTQEEADAARAAAEEEFARRQWEGEG